MVSCKKSYWLIYKSKETGRASQPHSKSKPAPNQPNSLPKPPLIKAGPPFFFFSFFFLWHEYPWGLWTNKLFSLVVPAKTHTNTHQKISGRVSNTRHREESSKPTPYATPLHQLPGGKASPHLSLTHCNPYLNKNYTESQKIKLYQDRPRLLLPLKFRSLCSKPQGGETAFPHLRFTQTKASNVMSMRFFF